MGTSYDSDVFFGVEVPEGTSEKMWETEGDSLDLPPGIDEHMTGNFLCGEGCQEFVVVVECTQRADCYEAQTLDLVVPSDEEVQALIDYAKLLGVENPEPKWMIGGSVG